MIKIYPTALINAIQTVINSGKFEIITYKDYSFFNVLTSAGVTLTPCTHPVTGNKSYSISIRNIDFTSKMLSDWKTTAPGKFFAIDYKKDNRDFIGNTLYHEVKLTINNKPLKVLVRLLNEITDQNMVEAVKKELIHHYGDITIDEKYFSVIKITDDTDRSTWGTPDYYKSYDIFDENDNIYNSNETYSIENIDTDNDENEIADDSYSSDPLF